MIENGRNYSVYIGFIKGTLAGDIGRENGVVRTNTIHIASSKCEGLITNPHRPTLARLVMAHNAAPVKRSHMQY